MLGFLSFFSHFDNIGRWDEVRFTLQTYGIPTECIPLDDDNNLNVEYHLSWLQMRRVQEQTTAGRNNDDNNAVVLVPRRFDVLFGKGKNVSDHTGNLRAYHIVEMNRQAYEEAGKFAKTQVAERIVKEINQSYGRFLKFEEEYGWVEVDHDTARDKISHFFRRMREREQQKGKTMKRPNVTSSKRAPKKRPSK